MQIFLNGKELDLNVNERVAITMQINDLGDLSKANTSYTNKFKIPKTPNNVQVMKFLGVPGHLSRIPYVLNDVTVIEDSLVLLSNGYAEINDADDKSYNLNIYGSEKTFFEKLKLYMLKDVYPVTNVLWTAETLLPRANATSNYVFPVAQYNGNTIHSGSLQNINSVFTRTKVTQTSPHFYVKYLFESIFTYLGYSVSYPVQSDPIFQRLVIPSQKGVSHFGVQYGDTFNIQNCVSEVTCDVLIKEIMFRYGLIIKVNEFEKKVTFTKLDTLIKNGSILDWTDKFSRFKNEKYSISGYGQKNFFKYKDDVAHENYPTIDPADSLLGSFEIDNQTLEPTKTIIDSSCIKPKMYRVVESNDWAKGRIFFWTTGTSHFLFDVAENTIETNGDVKLKEVPFQIQYLKNLTGTVAYRFERPDNTFAQLLVSNPKSASFDNLSFQNFIDSNYPQVINMLQTMNVLKCEMNLSILDVNNFDFHRRIYLEQFGSFFYVNKINNFQKNKITEVELIKIPNIYSNSDGGESYYGRHNNMIGTL